MSRKVAVLQILCLLFTNALSAAVPRTAKQYRDLPESRLTQADYPSYNIFEPDGPGTYAFGYEIHDPATGNVQFRDEERLRNGTVHGSYGYLLPDGRLSVTHYLADENGYQATTEVKSPEGQVMSTVHTPTVPLKPSQIAAQQFSSDRISAPTTQQQVQLGPNLPFNAGNYLQPQVASQLLGGQYAAQDLSYTPIRVTTYTLPYNQNQNADIIQDQSASNNGGIGGFFQQLLPQNQNNPFANLLGNIPFLNGNNNQNMQGSQVGNLVQGLQGTTTPTNNNPFANLLGNIPFLNGNNQNMQSGQVGNLVQGLQSTTTPTNNNPLVSFFQNPQQTLTNIFQRPQQGISNLLSNPQQTFSQLVQNPQQTVAGFLPQGTLSNFVENPGQTLSNFVQNPGQTVAQIVPQNNPVSTFLQTPQNNPVSNFFQNPQQTFANLNPLNWFGQQQQQQQQPGQVTTITTLPSQGSSNLVSGLADEIPGVNDKFNQPYNNQPLYVMTANGQWVQVKPNRNGVYTVNRKGSNNKKNSTKRRPSSKDSSWLDEFLEGRKQEQLSAHPDFKAPVPQEVTKA